MLYTYGCFWVLIVCLHAQMSSIREWLASDAPSHVVYGVLSMVGMPYTRELVQYIHLEEAAPGAYSASRVIKRIRHIQWILHWISEDRRSDNEILCSVARAAIQDA